MKGLQTLHLGCGTDTQADWWNVDAINHDGVDEVVDLNEHPWPWDDNSWCHIYASHVVEHLDSVEDTLRECQRILKPNGTVTIEWPIGMNERADPDHKHSMVWDTPEMYCGERPWDVDVGLEVARKDVSLVTHFGGFTGGLYKALLKGLELSQGTGRWMFDMPVTSGEFTIVFKNP